MLAEPDQDLSLSYPLGFCRFRWERYGKKRDILINRSAYYTSLTVQIIPFMQSFAVGKSFLCPNSQVETEEQMIR